MKDLNLEYGEFFILQAECVGKYTAKTENELDYLYLTPKNIIQVYDSENNFVEKIPLISIAIFDGEPMVHIIDHEKYGSLLEVVLKTNERILFDISGSPTKVFPEWETAVKKATKLIAPKQEYDDALFKETNNNSETVYKSFDKSTEPEFMDDKETFLGEDTEFQDELAKDGEFDKNEYFSINDVENVNEDLFNNSDNIDKKIVKFCSYCGGQLDRGAKFCKHCGTEVLSQSKSKKKEDKDVFYDGKVAKCPQCGEVIDAFDSNCPSCGYEIRGRQRISVVHKLALKIEKLNDEEKKDELIRNFYIPNTKEDIYEFFILATSYIKTGGMNTNSWMIKLEQAYQKAMLIIEDKTERDRLISIYNDAIRLNKRNNTSNILRNISKCFKSAYAWAILIGILGLLFNLFGTPSTSLTGLLMCEIALCIALFTAIIKIKSK